MKAITWILTVSIVFALGLPALAARGHGGGGGGGPREGKIITGRVMRNDGHLVKLALHVRVNNPDAPGKVPDEFAVLAARLDDLADEFERKGRNDEAAMNRRKARELRCWREVEAVVDPAARITGVVKTPLTQLKTGTRLAIEASVEGAIDRSAPPSSVTLMRDALQVGLRLPQGVHVLPRGPRDERTFLRVVGEVVSVNPLQLAASDSTVTIDNPRKYAYYAHKPLTVRDLRPNDRVLVRAVIRGENDVIRVNHVIVSDIENPVDLEDRLDL